MLFSRLRAWMERNRSALKFLGGSLTLVFSGLAGEFVLDEYIQGRVFYGTIALLFALVLLLNTGANAGFFDRVIRRINQLDSHHRLRIDFVAAGQESAPDAVHSRAKEFLEKARPGCEIFGVNSYLEATSHGDRETEAIRAYYETIEGLATHNARYTRVIQLPTGLAGKPYSVWAKEVKAHYKEHFDNIIAMRDDDHVGSADLLQVQSRFPLSFLLIRNNDGSHYLIWQIDEQIQDERFRMHGIFLVEDLDLDIARNFLRWIDELRHVGSRVERE